jgi:uncharacterized membrane protein YcaP (DUF421 family)
MSDIKPFDLKRIFIGDAPPEFLVEVLIRSIIVYIFLLIVIRLMGKRLSSQISITELAVMITLGGIISPAMQLPDRGILFAAVVLLAILFFHRGINWWATKSNKIETITQGEMICLVKDGVMQLDDMRKVGISRQELFAQLRSKKIENLSQVQRFFLEACGTFTVYKNKGDQPGLPLFPEKDHDIIQTKINVDHGTKACCVCGNVQQLSTGTDTCEVCHQQQWMDAYV